MKKKPQIKALVLGLMLGLAASQGAFAQGTTSSSLNGRVTDPEGRPIAGALVEIVHLPSNTRKTVSTDEQGRYASTNLRVGGPYKITVTKDGYAGEAQDDINLLLGEPSQINIDLDPAMTQLESIEVVASQQSDVFRSNNQGSTSNVSREQIDSFPSINRNIQDYVRLDPRIAQTDKARNEISAGGQNTRFNAIRIDGVNTSDAFGLESNSLPTPKQPISMDVIDAINVSVANYDVTIGGATGAVINAVTKSGTNEFHGSVYGTYRENDWSGKNQNDVRPDIFDTDETYGGTFGGPLIEDKLFFFANYEKSTFSGVGTNFGPVGSGATNIVNITQADIDQIIGIASGYGFDAGTLQLPKSLDTTSEEYAIKLDWNINEQHRASFRYSSSEQSQANTPGFGNNSLSLSSYLYQRDFQFDTTTAQLFSDWTDNFSTEFKLSYRDYSAVRTPASNLPAIAVRVGNATLNLGTEENTHANVLETQTWNSYFIGNYFVGDHEFKFGVDYEANDIFNLFGRRTNGVYTFNSINDFANGTSSRYQLYYPVGGNVDNMAADWGLDNIGFFVQDSWSVNYNLTMTYGFRVDIPNVSRKPTYNQAASETFGFRNDATIDGNELVQPRFGFNYTFDSERPTQLRGGMGLFQGAAATVWLSNPYSNTGLQYTDYFFSRGISNFSPNPNDQLAQFTPGTGATQSVDFIDPDLGQPAVWKANLAFDHELPWYGIVASAEVILTSVEEGIYYQQLNLGAPTAVGQDGRYIYWNANGLDPSRWNQFGSGTSVGSRANSNRAYNDAIIARSTSKGDGQQLTLSLQKPYEENWFWQVAYTYTDANEVSPLTSFTSSSQLGNVAIFNSNEEISARSNYLVKDRFSGAVSYRHFFFDDLKTEFSLVYEGRRGKPYSYTFDNDANGDGRFNDLLYIPSGPGDVLFGSPEEEAAFFAYVEGNEYLRSHMGEVAERNADYSSWVHNFDVRISQELPGFFAGNKAEIWLDILNIGNMIDKDWGVIEEIGFPLMRGIVEYGGIDAASGRYVYRFNTPDSQRVYDARGISRWALQLGFRYSF
ncbi:MAG: carboxypeptidase regulatory-like domain-containing protein [Lysobacterales bacterium]